jgi:hypothetical protein
MMRWRTRSDRSNPPRRTPEGTIPIRRKGEPLGRLARCFGAATLAIALAACAGSPSVAPHAAVDGPTHIEGLVTEISQSDHPAGLCEAENPYTKRTITFDPRGGSGPQLKAPVSTFEIVSTDPCTKRGSFTIELDPGSGYDVCVNSETAEPGAMDIVGSGTCGIRATSEMLQDGRFEITFDGRVTGPGYSTYS